MVKLFKAARHAFSVYAKDSAGRCFQTDSLASSVSKGTEDVARGAIWEETSLSKARGMYGSFWRAVVVGSVVVAIGGR